MKKRNRKKIRSRVSVRVFFYYSWGKRKRRKRSASAKKAFGAVMDAGLLRKSASFLPPSALCAGILSYYFDRGEKSGHRLVTFHLRIKDRRPTTEVEHRIRSQAESNQSPAPVD